MVKRPTWFVWASLSEPMVAWIVKDREYNSFMQCLVPGFYPIIYARGLTKKAATKMSRGLRVAGGYR